MKNFKKGFTLVELLVVVAIIAILAAVVLTSLSASRNKGDDAAVKANLNTIRGEAELFYANNGNSFLPSGWGTYFTSSCPDVSVGIFQQSMFSNDSTIYNAIAEAKKRGSGIAYCYNSSVNWAVAVGLKSDPNLSWCIDSGGNSRQVGSAPNVAIGGVACN